MRQKNSVDAFGIEREWLAVQILSLATPLKESAVQKKTKAIDLHEMTRAGDHFRCTAKRDLHGFYLLQ